MKCLGCFYYSGVQCHGHGEFWGSCRLLSDFVRYFDSKYKDKFISSFMSDLCYDDTECLILSKKYNYSIEVF